MLHVAVEIYPNISSSHFFFYYVPNAHTEIINAKVFCSSSDLKIVCLTEENGETCYNVTLPDNIFIPSSFSTTEKTFDVQMQHDRIVINHSFKNTKRSATAFNFRLQLAQNNTRLLKTALPLSVLEYFKKTVISNCYYQVICSDCNAIQSNQPVYFQNVHEYCPYSELSENWFCHTSQGTFQQLACHNLYVDALALYIHSSIVETFNLNFDGEHLKCRNCNQILSIRRHSQNFLKFFIDKLYFKAVEENVHEQEKDKISLSILSVGNMISAGQNLNCKIYLQSKPEDPCLLLRAPGAPLHRFLLTCRPGQQEQGLVFAPQPARRVLYLLAAPGSEAARRWRSDFAVDFHEVSCGMLRSLAEHLEESGRHAQPDTPRPDGFSYGWLPVYSAARREERTHDHRKQ